MLSPKLLSVSFFWLALMFQGGTGYKVVDRYPIGGVGGFDYVTIDSSARRTLRFARDSG